MPSLSYEDQLVKEILHKYRVRGKYGRPVRRFNDTLKVAFGIQLIQIMDLNEKDQILTLNVWDQYVSIYKKNISGCHCLVPL